MEVYISDLKYKLECHKSEVLRQKGSSDIEPCDYDERIEAWYDQMNKFININPPINYVKALSVIQRSDDIIEEVKYIYYSDDVREEHFYINILWNK